MANKIAWIYVAVDKFSNIGKKVSKIVEDNSKKFKNLGEKAEKSSKKVTKGLEDNKKAARGAAFNFKNLAIQAAAFFSARDVIRTGAAFQDSLQDLSSITGAVGKDLAFLGEESLRLAKSAKITQTEVVNAFTDIASAKSELLDDPKALSNITEQALLLANATGISLTSAVQASVGALNQFNKGSEDAARFVNVLAAGSKVGAAQVFNVVESLKNAGSVAAQFNVTFEETNALIQVLAKNGVKGAEAGTALRGTLSKLEKLMGGRFAPSRMGIIKSLESVEKLGLSNTQIIKEFGEENLRSILILRQNVPLLKQWTQEITGTNIAQEQADKRLSTFNAKLRGVGVVVKDKLIRVFLALEPVLTKNIELFTTWLDRIDPASLEAFGKGIGVIIKGFSILGRVVGAVFEIIKDIASLFGQTIAAVTTLDFSQFDFGDTRQPDSIAERFGFTPVTNKTQTDVNVTVNAPEGVVKSVEEKTTGENVSSNVGLNMATAL